jgi:sugar phosphate isomerase/epimerase
MTSDTLFDSYRRTIYSAETPLGTIRLRVGERNEELAALLKRYGATRWAYVTAFNPGSQQLASEENFQRQSQLEDSLRHQMLTFFPGEGVGDDSSWPSEKSVLILNISRERAIHLAREFGQNAILVGGESDVPELVDCQV